MRWLLLPLLGAALGCPKPAPPADFTLRLGVIGEVGPVAPDAQSGAAALATDLVFESVIRPVPGGWDSRFLRRWERLGPRRWRLELKEGVRFSDGSVVGPGDVAEAVRRRAVRVVSTAAAGLEVETPAASPLETQLALAIVAKQVGERWVGTGPFSVTGQAPGGLVLTRVEAVPGRIHRVELIPCATGREALVRLLRGELGGIPSLDPANAELLDGVPKLRILRGNAPHAIAIMLNPRLSAAERRALVPAVPVAEIAAAIRREPCCGEGSPPRLVPPPGVPLRIGYPRSLVFRRAALALRQGLGARGGDVRPLGTYDLAGWSKDFDLLATSILVRPPGIVANYLRTGADWNFTGYSNAVYDAALASGDEAAASEALAEDPPMVIVARRERVGAVDARLANARLGDWGILETLPEWEVSP
ncbi:MAG: hypothetical protein HZB56_20780 [Deltaproteobacteria bacterium]|nr:hypothetical protein [Deltaproteobacteria bacterium]